MEARATQQPDFAAAAGAFRLIADNLDLCPNVPAFDGGHRIMLMLAELRDLVNNLDRKLDASNRNYTDRFNVLDRKLDASFNTLDRKLDASNRNNTARLANAIVVSGEMSVSPLYSLETGQEIPHCPPTLAALEALTNEQVASLLRALGESVPRRLDDRIRTLNSGDMGEAGYMLEQAVV